MSKFISSSIWNFIANFILRIISITTFPFLVRFYLREDIAIFKSFQSFVLILMAIIPIGTNILYLSVSQEKRKDRWNLFFYTSLMVSVLMSFALYFVPSVSSFFIESDNGLLLRLLIIIVPLMEGLKIILITKLSGTMDFKNISIALIVKQLFLYGCVISFAYIRPVLPILLLSVFISEIIELLMLYFSCIHKGVSLKPVYLGSFEDNSSVTKSRSWLKSLNIDREAKKYIGFSGTQQIFITFATQFPIVLVVIVLGRELAPEFQLPFAAVNIPVTMVMRSIVKVSFPHFSNLRDNDRIVSSLFSILFPITFILFPIMVAIHFFAAEISGLFLDASWSDAIIALQVFPMFMIVYVVNMPTTYISNIKGKPQIDLVYAVFLFAARILGIYYGYKLGGFLGTVMFFSLGDMLVRLVRLKVDIKLLDLTVKKYFNCIRYNFYSMLLLAAFAWLGHLGIQAMLPGALNYQSKILSFAVTFGLIMLLNYQWEKERIKQVVSKIRHTGMTDKRENHG